jgi:hypothetical protein
MKNAVCPISLFVANPCISQGTYIKNWYWHGMLKFVAAGSLEDALEYVRRAYEIVLSVRTFQYNKWRTA